MEKDNIKYLFVPEDLHLFDYNQIFGNSCVWLEQGMQDNIATFDLYIRKVPNRNYFAFCGLQEIVDGILNWKYSRDEIKFLLENGIITEKFAKYLENFKFTGDVWTMPEGTIFFPEEPVIRITAPLIEANLITFFLMEAFTSNTLFLSKVLRVVTTAAPIPIAGIFGMRAHSFESSMKSARASYLAGTFPIALPAFYRKYNIKMEKDPLMIVYHATVKSFPTELEAFRKVNELFPNRVGLMIDTYDIKQGLKNAITVAKELKENGKALMGVVIDSGDLAKECKYVREELDKAGFSNIKIVLASNLDEYKIKKLKEEKVPLDIALVNTEGVTSSDSPILETVYKLAELQKNGKIMPVAKFAQGKKSYPGKKQVFRSEGFKEDVIGLEDENLGKALLIKIIEKGKLVYDIPSLEETRVYIQKQIKELPKELLDIKKEQDYPVKISDKLRRLTEEVKKKHIKKS